MLALSPLLACGPLPLWAAVACVMLHASDDTGRVIGAHLMRRDAPWSDLAARALALLVPGAPPAWVGGGLLVCLARRANSPPAP